MEELRCKGTPAQVMRRVFAILAEDTDLLWITDASRASYSQAELDNLAFWGRLAPTIPDDQEVVKVMILRGAWPVIGYITAERLPDYVLVTASNRAEKQGCDEARGGIALSLTENLAALAPVWERVKAELERRGLVMAAEPAQDAAKKRGPTENTRLRAKKFREIKAKHREWGYGTVAQKAAEELNADNITESTVRNAYRAMGWEWERADRIR